MQELELGMGACVCNLSTGEAGAEESQVQSLPGLQSEFEASLGNLERSHLKE